MKFREPTKLHRKSGCGAPDDRAQVASQRCPISHRPHTHYTRPRAQRGNQLTQAPAVPTLQSMEVQFSPEIQARLDRLANETGRAKDQFVQDAMLGYPDELEQTRKMLDSRYDDIKSGRVQPIDGEEAFARLREKSEARRNSRA